MGHGGRRLPPDQYRLLIDSSPVMIWRSGVDGKCDYFNETWLRFTGRSVEQELGDGWADGVHPGDLGRCLDFYQDHFRRREPFGMEYRLRRCDGVHRWIFDRGVPFFDDAGAFGGFIGSCIDVHERREADAARGRFLGVVARELALPVSSLSLLAVRLRRNQLEGEVDEQVLERLVQRVQRLDGVVAELADAVRFEQRTPGVDQPRAVELGSLVGEIVGAYVQVRTMSGDSRPGPSVHLRVGPGDLWAKVDERCFEQMLGHLLDNAVGYSPASGPVDVTVDPVDGEVHLTVVDRGIGIPSAEIPRVVERYYRASNAPAPEIAGPGLGLSIVHELCMAHGGRLEIESALGVGTKVTIRLPSLTASGTPQAP